MKLAVDPLAELEALRDRVAHLEGRLTEAQRQIAVLGESEERHRRLLVTLPDAVIIHSGGKVAYVNPAAIVMFGADSHTGLVGRGSADLVHPDSRLLDADRARVAIDRRRSPSPVEQKWLRLDASVIHVESRTAFIVWNGKPAILVVARDLAGRKRAEAALRESERRFSTIADNFWGAVYQQVMDSESRFSFPYVSHGVLDTHGVTAEAAMAEPGRLMELVHADDRDRVEGALRASARRLAPLDVAARTVRPDGAVIWVRSIARVHARDDGSRVWDGLFVDITDRWRAEEHLQQSEECYRRLVELSPDAIHVHRDGRIAFVNSAAVRLFAATTADDLIGRSTFDHVLAEDHVMLRSRQEAVLAGDRTPMIEQRRRRLDGWMFWAAVTAIPLIWKGKPAALVVTRDITEAKMARHDLQRAKEAAESANRSKTEFLANMSHELRTPLNAVIGFSDIMMNEMFGPIGDDTYRGYARDINDSGSHLLGLINNILDLSKVEAGGLMPRLETVAAADAIAASIRFVAGKANEGGIDIVPDLADDLPPLRADGRMLRQILMNLLSNAVKFTPAGGRVRIETSMEPDSVLAIRVRDTGIGIAPKNIPVVMAPFGQVDGAMSRKHHGTGLGLPLSCLLAEVHGGSLLLDSEVGVGTTVTVRLPVAGPSRD